MCGWSLKMFDTEVYWANCVFVTRASQNLVISFIAIKPGQKLASPSTYGCELGSVPGSLLTHTIMSFILTAKNRINSEIGDWMRDYIVCKKNLKKHFFQPFFVCSTHRIRKPMREIPTSGKISLLVPSLKVILNVSNTKVVLTFWMERFFPVSQEFLQPLCNS